MDVLHILLKLGTRSRDEVVRVTRRHVDGGQPTLEDRGWMALSVPAPGPSVADLEALAKEAGCVLVLEWAMDSVNRSGTRVYDPARGRWFSAGATVEGQSEAGDWDGPRPPVDFVFRRSATSDRVAEELAEDLELARHGDVDALLSMADDDPYRAYFWMHVAQDLGHDVDDLLCVFDEHYFRHEEGLADERIGCDLVTAYLEGTIVPKDVERARSHLQRMVDEWQLSFEALSDLHEDHPQVESMLVERLGTPPFWPTVLRLRRLQCLHALKAPPVILDDELRELAASVERLRGRLGNAATEEE